MSGRGSPPIVSSPLVLWVESPSGDASFGGRHTCWRLYWCDAEVKRARRAGLHGRDPGRVAGTGELRADRDSFSDLGMAERMASPLSASEAAAHFRRPR